MRLLLINQYAGAPSLGMEFRPHWMARHWMELGHEVLVVTGSVSHLRRHPIPVGDHVIEGVPFLVLDTSNYHGNGVARFRNILSFRSGLRRSRRQLSSWSPDVVIASSTHPMDVRPAASIASRSEARFVYEVHDLWPLTPRLLGGLPRWHPMILWMQREENFGYARADVVVSLLPRTETYMAQHGLSAGKWVWIPNGIDERAAGTPAEVPVCQPLHEFRERHRRVLIYAGTVGKANALGLLLDQADAFARLGIGVVILGDGPERSELMAAFGRHQHILWLDPVPRPEVHSVLELADGAYLGLLPSPLFEHGVSPNKLYDYMAAGLPVLENIGASHSPVAEIGCGWVASPLHSESLRAALEAFAAAEGEELVGMGLRGREYVFENLTEGRLSRRMLEVMA